jgi:hypothetical protein
MVYRQERFWHRHRLAVLGAATAVWVALISAAYLATRPPSQRAAAMLTVGALPVT